MENERSALEDYKDFGKTPESGRNEQQLSEFLARKQTPDNLEKLAKNLTAIWSKPKGLAKKPDLSFAAFKEKLKNAGNQ